MGAGRDGTTASPYPRRPASGCPRSKRLPEGEGWLTGRPRGIREGWRLVVAGVCAPVAFVVACPYTVLDTAGFLGAFEGDIVGWAATGHAGWDGDVLVTYLRWLFLGSDAPTCWLALLGIALGLVGRRWGAVARSGRGGGLREGRRELLGSLRPDVAGVR